MFFSELFFKLYDSDILPINMVRVTIMIKGIDDNIIMINVTYFRTTMESEAVILTAGESSASVTYV